MNRISAELQTEFAVDMTCEKCVESVKSALTHVHGISRIETELGEQRVLIQGSAPPSQLHQALKSTGKTIILRGCGVVGREQNNLAAVCMLEKSCVDESQQASGLIRMIKLDDNCTLFDIVADGLNEQSTYSVSVHEFGDISRGHLSTGQVYATEGGTKLSFDNQTDISGRLELVTEAFPIKLWQLIGRSICIYPADPQDSTILCGIIARSSGVFANEKKICACSGRSLWEEAAFSGREKL